MAWVNRLKLGATVGALAALPVLANGCSSSNPLSDVCCTDFKPGTDMSTVTFVGDAQVNGQFVAFAQASGDIAAIAASAVADVTAACQGIATDLGEDANPAGAQGKSGSDLMNFWCDDAVAKINAAAGGSAQGKLQINFEPPKCSASIQAQANCQAKCDVSGKCDIKANPPKCTGGTLQIDCKGNCTASAGASVHCEGSCSGNCSGSCEASGGVQCQGRCDGSCSVATDSGGNCNGTCKGTCSATPPGVKCSGSCKGSCDASCQASAGASVKCDGKCDADYQPISCEGGKLEGGCNVDAKCQGNCNASASAKAECTPPELTIVATGSATGQIDALIASLKLHLPQLLVVVKARGQAFVDTFSAVVDGGLTISGSGKLDVKGTACLTAAGFAVAAGVDQFKASLAASLKVTGSVGQ